MSGPLRLAINGASGRMGGALLGLLQGDDRFELCHAVVAAGSDLEGAAVYSAQDGSLHYTHGWEGAPPLDVVVDFSNPPALAAALEHCVARDVALVSGTTGLDARLQQRLDDASKKLAIVHAANFSLGVAVLTRLLREAAAVLPDWDLEIVEAHHGRKLDAPSGTALALGRAAAQARRTSLDTAAIYSRADRSGQRAEGSIGFASIRGGDIVGEHAAMLIGHGERLELTHRATDRSIFARGALHAAHWLGGRGPGRWQLDDVLATPR
jgi:4-hydroxy-tetrahydrodipicolinate reductase